MTKPTIFSGIQPSGHLMIGNYTGALKNWVELQDHYHCLFVMVDLHTISVQQDPAELRQHTYDLIAMYLACGLDPKKNLIFVQSHVTEHAELAWILSCYTFMGELNRMTQYKDKAARHQANINAGLFGYPVLMAADILLYNTNLVPVGNDQKQHMELTRDIAQRFNARHGEVFTVPEGYYPKVGARIMSLQNPDKKMSKSDSNSQNYIAMLDQPSVILKKCKRAVTDSDTDIRFDPENKAGISNLMSIYATATGSTMDDVQNAFEGKGYGDFKKAVGEAVVAMLEPIQKRYHEIRKDETSIEKMLQVNAEKARELARPTLEKVYDAVGFVKPLR